MPGRQLGFLWGGVSALLLALSPLAPRLAGALPPCLFKTITGIPCPTCGTTRAAVALAGFDPLYALLHYPLPTLGWLAFFGGGFAAFSLALAGQPLPRLPRKLPVGVRLAVLGVLLAGWFYAIATGV